MPQVTSAIVDVGYPVNVLHIFLSKGPITSRQTKTKTHVIVGIYINFAAGL